jgi:hypothetical protein
MQNGFPHFQDRDVATVQRGIDVRAQRVLRVGVRDTGECDEAPLATGQPRPLPHVGEDETQQVVVDRCGVRRRGNGHDVGVGQLAAVGARSRHCRPFWLTEW